MTNINNDAEKGKVTYDDKIVHLNVSNLSDVAYSENEIKESAEIQSKNSESIESTKYPTEDSVDNLEEDIDFLLSLKEPVQSNPTITPLLSTSHNNGKILD